jgi:hypothetical protein
VYPSSAECFYLEDCQRPEGQWAWQAAEKAHLNAAGAAEMASFIARRNPIRSQYGAKLHYEEWALGLGNAE